MEKDSKMLVVEDSEELRQSLYDQFTQEHFNVDIAEDGVVALGLIKKNDYVIA